MFSIPFRTQSATKERNHSFTLIIKILMLFIRVLHMLNWKQRSKWFHSGRYLITSWTVCGPLTATSFQNNPYCLTFTICIPFGFKVFRFLFFLGKSSFKRAIQCVNRTFSSRHGSAIFPDFFHVASFFTAFLHYISGRAILVESTEKAVGFSFIRQHRPYTNDQM